MGKKSRRRTKSNETTSDGKIAHIPRKSSGLPSPSNVVSYVSESYFKNPFDNEQTPINGWGRELKVAERELRRSPNSIDCLMRAAKASRATRQFGRLEQIMQKAESVGATIDSANGPLLAWKDDCASYKNRFTLVNEPETQQLFASVMKDDTSLDTTNIVHPTYTNLNALQYAAYQGDVQLMERIVAAGAALDYKDGSVSNNTAAATTRRSRQGQPIEELKTKKPPESTALLLAVTGAICARQWLAADGEEQACREMYEGEIECAIQLVRLGANCNVRLQLPGGREGFSKPSQLMKIMDLAGKSVQELAHQTGSELLVQTIEKFKSNEAKIELVNCRCGSRLPWRQCHAGKDYDRHYKKGNKGQNARLIWKHSPLAPCPCKLTQKVYFRCCWDEVAYKEYFQDDETVDLEVSMVTSVNDDNRAQIMETIANSNDGDTMFDSACNMHPNQILIEMSQCGWHPKSKVKQWDRNIVSGVMKRMDAFFQWNDVHWNIPKPELLMRLAMWNKALEKYCDDVGVVGRERDDVIKLHTASPFAPCANVNCEKMEAKVKEFSRCARCLSVSYCSETCQKEDYSFHKTRCLKR